MVFYSLRQTSPTFLYRSVPRFRMCMGSIPVDSPSGGLGIQCCTVHVHWYLSCSIILLFSLTFHYIMQVMVSDQITCVCKLVLLGRITLITAKGLKCRCHGLLISKYIQVCLFTNSKLFSRKLIGEVWIDLDSLSLSHDSPHTQWYSLNRQTIQS